MVPLVVVRRRVGTSWWTKTCSTVAGTVCPVAGSQEATWSPVAPPSRPAAAGRAPGGDGAAPREMTPRQPSEAKDHAVIPATTQQKMTPSPGRPAGAQIATQRRRRGPSEPCHHRLPPCRGPPPVSCRSTISVVRSAPGPGLLSGGPGRTPPRGTSAVRSCSAFPALCERPSPGRRVVRWCRPPPGPRSR